MYCAYSSINDILLNDLKLESSSRFVVEMLFISYKPGIQYDLKIFQKNSKL